MFSRQDPRAIPPALEFPRPYNAAADLLDRQIDAGRAGHVAFKDNRTSLTYGALLERSNRVGNALRSLGMQPEQRVRLRG